MLPFNEETQCYVERLEYDFEHRAGKLFMGENSCTDMSGCIRLFSRIDPMVELIETFASPSHPRRDTAYRRRNGKWQAGLPAKAVTT
jgi:hypothetical protein